MQIEWRQMAGDKHRMITSSALTLFASGLCLAVHFGTFVWGLQHTSLPHSLLFLSSTPIILSVGAVFLRKPISNGELLGAVMGIIGILILALGWVSSLRLPCSPIVSLIVLISSACLICCSSESSSADEASVKGDLASFVAAVAIAGYLSAGSKLREWMPLFVYALPVTGEHPPRSLLLCRR